MQGNVILHKDDTSCPSVLFIPGIQASRLYWRDADGEARQVWEPSYFGDAQYLALNEAGQSIYHIEAGQPIGELRFLANLYTDPVYAGLFRRLETYANQCGSSFSTFGYDWRLPLDHPDTMQALKEVIDALHTAHPERQIVFVTHSMGGLIAKQYIAKHDTAVIDGVVFIGTPHVGTPKSYASILHGDGFDIAGGLILSEAAARRIAAFSTAALSLFPSGRFFDTASTTIEYFGELHNSPDTIRDFLLASRDDKRESQDTSIPVSVGSYLLNQVEDMHTLLDDMEFPKHMRLVSIIGTGRPTLRGLQYRQKIEQRCGSFGGSCITKTSVEHMPLFRTRGDGTVLTASAKYIPGTQHIINLWDKEGSEGQAISHYNMTELPNVQECIINFLKNQVCQLTGTDTNQVFVTIGVHSPLVANSPDEVTTFGDASYISYPLDGEEYESVWRGIAHGSAELTVSLGEGRQMLIPNPIFVGTSTSIQVRVRGEGQSAQLEIAYDYEGDGMAEYVQYYVVSEHEVRRDRSLLSEDRYGLCTMLEPYRWPACFLEGVIRKKALPLIEEALYGRNVLTGQRQEAVMNSESDS